jgi:DNA invertase Pin-like site-specific DNA recombinase
MPRRKRTTALTVRELGPGSRVYAYLRDSGGQGQERSIAEQRTAISKAAEARGWTVVDWYVDAATQSGDYARRGAFAALLDDCRRNPGRVAGVVMDSLSRFGRDEYDSQFYRLELRRAGVQVASVSDQIPAGPLALVFEAFYDWKNRVFLDDLSYQVRKGLLANVMAGYAPGGRPPTGYMAVREQIGQRRNGQPRIAARWVPDPAVAPRVQRAFQLAAAGLSYRVILAETQLCGAETTLRSMLCNRSYLGVYKLGAEEYPGLEPLVDAETFGRVQARMVTRAEHARKARRMTSEFLLSGLARCGECDALLDGDVDLRRNARYYRCRTVDCPVGRVRAAPAERTVRAIVLERVLVPEVLLRLLAELQRALDDPGVALELEELGGRIGGKKHSIAALLDAIEDGAGAETKARLAVREGELAGLEARRELLLQRRALGTVALSPEQAAEIATGMRAQVESHEVETARHALAQYVGRAQLWVDRCRVEFAVADVGALVTGYSEVPPRGFALLPGNWGEPVERYYEAE